MLVNDTDLSRVLLEDYKEHESEFNEKKHNKTSLFVLPMVGLSIGTNITNRYLRNAFIDDSGIEHDFVRPLFVLFRVENQKEKFWSNFCKVISSTECYVTDYYVGMDENKNNLIMYVFKIPEKWTSDFEAFKAGKYSQMSNAYKSKFVQYTYSASGAKRETRMWGILNKSENLKDEVVKTFIVPQTTTADEVVALRRDINFWSEIWDAPQEDEEIFLFNKEYNAANVADKAEIHSQKRNDSAPCI